MEPEPQRPAVRHLFADDFDRHIVRYVTQAVYCTEEAQRAENPYGLVVADSLTRLKGKGASRAKVHEKWHE